MMAEREIDVSHTTIMRWVHQYGPELDKKIRRKLKLTGDSWKLDETYIKIKGKWKYLYRAVDKQGNTLDFYLSSHKARLAAARFLKKLILAEHTTVPRSINTDKNAVQLSNPQNKLEVFLMKLNIGKLNTLITE